MTLNLSKNLSLRISLCKTPGVFRVICFFSRSNMRTYAIACSRWTRHAEPRGKEKRLGAIARWIIEQCTLAYLLRIFRHLCPAQSCSRIIVSQSRLLLPLSLRWRGLCVITWCVSAYPDINYFSDFARETVRERKGEGDEERGIFASSDLYNGILPSSSSSFLAKVSLVWHTTIHVQLTYMRED